MTTFSEGVAKNASEAVAVGRVCCVSCTVLLASDTGEVPPPVCQLEPSRESSMFL